MDTCANDWIDNADSYICSNCGNESNGAYDKCPHCGALMNKYKPKNIKTRIIVGENSIAIDVRESTDYVYRMCNTNHFIQLTDSNGKTIYVNTSLITEIHNLEEPEKEQQTTITWVPLSEREPPEAGIYLVTTVDGDVDRYTFINDGKFDWWRANHAKDYPIAWAELPKGYQR